MTLRSLLSTVAVLSAFSSCALSGPVCSPANCNGCCDDKGICQGGTTAAVCGASANTCVSCGANEACNAGTCAPVQPAGSDGGNTGGGEDGGTLTCPTTLVSCEDQVLLEMGLKSTVNPDSITNVADGAGWISTINATGGGASPTKAFVYGAFTADGLTKVSFSDEQALSNVLWDISFRRFILRLNGGDSGPSCVSAAIAGGATFDSVSANTSTGVSEMDGFFDDSCAFVDDGSGLPTSPKTAMSGFYAYQQCVRMTGAVYVVTLADGRKVKAEVLGYYQSDAAQAACQSGTPQQGAVGGYIKLRWAFL